MKKILLVLLVTSQTFASFGQTKKVTVKLHSIVGYGQNEAFARKAIAALEDVLNSDEFETRLKAMTFKKTNGLTNQKLYEAIIIAHEQQGPGGDDGVVDLRARTVTLAEDGQKWTQNCQIGSTAGTQGIDGSGTGVTAVCPQWLAKWATDNNVGELAGHYAHEYMHILGFGHYRWWLNTRKFRDKTFVYKIGNLVSELVEKQLRDGQ